VFPEQQAGKTPKAMKEVFGGMPLNRVTLNRVTWRRTARENASAHFTASSMRPVGAVLAAASFRIGRFHGPLVVQEKFLAERSWDHVESTRRHIQVEKAC
jgi:hypothetical protein